MFWAVPTRISIHSSCVYEAAQDDELPRFWTQYPPQEVSALTFPYPRINRSRPLFCVSLFIVTCSSSLKINSVRLPENLLSQPCVWNLVSRVSQNVNKQGSQISVVQCKEHNDWRTRLKQCMMDCTGPLFRNSGTINSKASKMTRTT